MRISWKRDEKVFCKNRSEIPRMVRDVSSNEKTTPFQVKQSSSFSIFNNLFALLFNGVQTYFKHSTATIRTRWGHLNSPLGLTRKTNNTLLRISANFKLDKKKKEQRWYLLFWNFVFFFSHKYTTFYRLHFLSISSKWRM